MKEVFRREGLVADDVWLPTYLFILKGGTFEMGDGRFSNA